MNEVSKMNAEEIYMKLGFEMYSSECNYQNPLIYKKKINSDYVKVICYPNKTYLVSFEKIFLDEFGEDFYEWIYPIDMDLNQAINKQIKELGWIK